MAADVKVTTPKCVLDADDCVTLRDILASFNAPINEEHAWALYYQCAKCFESGIDNDRTKCFLVSEWDHILMHKDGYVHSNTIFAGGTDGGSSRVPMTSSHTLVFNLGIVIFGALDYGLDEEEERHLSTDLDRLIRLTTETAETPKHHEMDDEGIERDSGEIDEDPTLYHTLLSKVIEHCTNHLGSKATAQSADQHYRAVVKALVCEALELSSFLQKISSRGGTHDLLSKTKKEQTVELGKLQISEWSRLWLQVIQELRHGVNLKKVDFSRTRIEFTLTPYEILMDDIRSRRYKLKQVMVNGDLPHRVKKDAHAVILDFIRSRPPLRKASERKLAPPRARKITPREMLMDSIKIGSVLRPSISPAPTPHHSPMKKRVVPLPNLSALTTLRDESQDIDDGSGKPTRRLIKVDFSMFDDDDVDDEDDELPCANGADAPDVAPSAKAENGHPVAAPRHRKTNSGGGGNPWQRTAYDLATKCSPSGRASIRRHTIVVSGNGVVSGGEVGSQSVPHSRPESRGPSLSAASSESDSTNLGEVLPEMMWSRSSLQDEFLHSKNWQQAMECLSLTLEEIVHIRSVLTKAELESLPVEGRVKEDVEKRKVCFLCLKTRFGLFGPWGQICKLCKRTVCVKCYSKMRIPTEHFSRVPVFALSPGLSSPEDDKESFPRSLMNRLMVPEGTRNSVGSAPNSPQLQRGESISAPGSRMATSLTGSIDGPQSLPALSPDSVASEKRARLSRSKTIGRPESKTKENLKGLQMNVCHDCKTMVIQIIKSSRTNRTNAIRNLTLNLSPVY